MHDVPGEDAVMESVALRVAETGDVVHSANWTFQEYIGQTSCGWVFATPKNQWQRYAPDGRMIARRALLMHGGGPLEMTVLDGHEDVNCMTCLVRDLA